MSEGKDHWEKIGSVDITDFTTVLICDPVKLVHSLAGEEIIPNQKNLASLEKVAFDSPNIAAKVDSLGGIVASTGLGEGTYDVMARVRDCGVSEIRIVFDSKR